MNDRSRANARDESGIDVDLSEKDGSKAVNRNGVDDDRRLPSSEDSDVSVEERNQRDFLERNRAVQKRIGRITKRYDQRFAEQEARHQRELRDVRTKLDKLEVSRGGGGDADDAAHKRAMDKLQADYEAALESGNSKQAASINREMIAKEQAFWAAKTSKQLGTEQREQRRERERDPNDPAGKDGRPDVRPQAAQEFLDANEEWWDDEDDEDAFAAKTLANAIHAKLLQEGSNPASKSHYKKIVAKVKAKFPTVKIRVDDESDDIGDAGADADEEDEELEERSQRTPVRQMPNRGQAPAQRKGGKVRLTRDDLENMKRYGMDPENDKHVSQYAKEKQDLAGAQR